MFVRVSIVLLSKFTFWFINFLVQQKARLIENDMNPFKIKIAVHAFVTRPLIFKLKQVSKFIDICMSRSLQKLT